MPQDPDINEPREDGTTEEKTDNEHAAREALVKRIVDSLPPLTEEQKDVLALIFGRHHRS